MKKTKAPSFAARQRRERLVKILRPRAAVLEAVALKLLLVAAEARRMNVAIHPDLASALGTLAQAMRSCPRFGDEVPVERIEGFSANEFGANCGPSANVLGALTELADAIESVRLGVEETIKARALGDPDLPEFNRAIERLRTAARKFEESAR